MQIKLDLNKKAVSTVVSSFLVICIVIASVAGILGWGIPYIEDSKRDTQMSTSENDFMILEESIGHLIQSGIDSKKIAYITNSNDKGSIYVKSSETRMIIWYSLKDDFDFSVYGLNDDDYNNFGFETPEDLENVDATVWWYDDTCFLAGTQVLMADGSYKNIEDVEIGDRVKAYDEKNDIVVDSIVTSVFTHQPEEMNDYYLMLNNDLKVTPNHRFYSDGNWIQAGNLKVGDILFSSDKKVCFLNSIRKIYKKMPTFDLSIEGCHNYFVSMNNVDVLVHNEDLSYDISIRTKKYPSDDPFNVYTGYPYKFKFIFTDGPEWVQEAEETGNLDYKFNWSGEIDTNWSDVGNVYHFFSSATNQSVKVQVTDGTHRAETKKYYITNYTENTTDTSIEFGDFAAPRSIKVCSTLIDTPDSPISIVKSTSDGNDTYDITIEDNAPITGSIRVDIYDTNTYGGVFSIGKIFLFDLGYIVHNLPYTDGTSKIIFQNSAILSNSKNSINNQFVDEPDFYLEQTNGDKNILGLRITQLRSGTGNTVKSGIDSYKVRIQLANNFIADVIPNPLAPDDHPRDEIYGLNITITGENSPSWLKKLKDNYNFIELSDNRVKYNYEGIDKLKFMLITAVIKADITG